LVGFRRSPHLVQSLIYRQASVRMVSLLCDCSPDKE